MHGMRSHGRAGMVTAATRSSGRLAKRLVTTALGGATPAESCRRSPSRSSSPTWPTGMSQPGPGRPGRDSGAWAGSFRLALLVYNFTSGEGRRGSAAAWLGSTRVPSLLAGRLRPRRVRARAHRIAELQALLGADAAPCSSPRGGPYEAAPAGGARFAAGAGGRRRPADQVSTAPGDPAGRRPSSFERPAGGFIARIPPISGASRPVEAAARAQGRH